MSTECYDSTCEFLGPEGPFCDEPICRKDGEVLKHSEGNFFVSFRGKQYGWFTSLEGAETHLQMLRENVDV